jgi:hypothetical protein
MFTFTLPTYPTASTHVVGYSYEQTQRINISLRGARIATLDARMADYLEMSRDESLSVAERLRAAECYCLTAEEIALIKAMGE